MSNTTTVREPHEGLRCHKLMPTKIRRSLPPLYATEDIAIDEKALNVAYFCPYNGWHWYVVEFDGSDICFGYVEGFEKGWGYFSLRELAELTVLDGVPAVERDCSFSPVRFGDLKT